MVQPASFNATFNGRTQHLRAGMVSWQWFQVFGAKPILGRSFLPEEDQKGADRVIVLSYAAWQRLFSGRHDVIDKTLLLDDQAYRVIGVMRVTSPGRGVWSCGRRWGLHRRRSPRTNASTSPMTALCG